MKKKKSRGLATRSLGLRARCRVVAWRARKSQAGPSRGTRLTPAEETRTPRFEGPRGSVRQRRKRAAGLATRSLGL